MHKTKVTISRKWNNPYISTLITNDEIQLSMELEDFKKALLLELGSVTMVFTKDQLEKKVNAAFSSIVSGIKEESAKVV